MSPLPLDLLTTPEFHWGPGLTRLPVMLSPGITRRDIAISAKPQQALPEPVQLLRAPKKTGSWDESIHSKRWHVITLSIDCLGTAAMRGQFQVVQAIASPAPSQHMEQTIPSGKHQPEQGKPKVKYRLLTWKSGSWRAMAPAWTPAPGVGVGWRHQPLVGVDATRQESSWPWH